MATQEESQPSIHWLGLAAIDASAAWLCALIVEGFGTFLVDGERGLGIAALATLVAVQWLLQIGAALLLWPARALAVRRGALGLWGPVAYVSAFAAAGLYRVVPGLTSGAWIQNQSYVGALRWGLILGGTVLAGLGTFLWFSPTLHGRRGLRQVLIAVAFALGLAFTYAHARILTGLYPAAHLAFVALATVLMQLAVNGFLEERVTAWPAVARFVGSGGVASLLAMIILSVLMLPPTPSVTTDILLQSPRGSTVLRLVLPPASTEDLRARLANLNMSPASYASAPRPTTFTIPADWNVVLVVVDALRADALPPDRDTYPKRRFGRDDMPFLSGLVDKAYRFERAYGGATYTYRSMPSMFHSQWANRDRTKGLALARLMAEHGRTPIAVVPDVFMEPSDPGLRAMLDGFASVDVFPRYDQNLEPPMIASALTRFDKAPFFLWLHHAGVHSPGWDGTNMERDDDRWPQNYKKGLRWADDQVAALYHKLEADGVADRTVFVITSDHGEGLLDNGDLWHGPNVYEEAARVPLSIYIPGRPGGVIHRTVGNIDIAPTLLALMGGAPEALHQGHSLVPLLENPDAPWNYPYLVLSAFEEQAAVVRGSLKHIVDHATGAHLHFDLTKDPLEEHGVFNPQDPLQAALLGDLIDLHPILFAEELDNPDTAGALDQRLLEVAPDKPPVSLPFLLSLVHLAPTEARVGWALHLFQHTPHAEVRAQVLLALYDLAPEAFAHLSLTLLSAMTTDADRERFVVALADVRAEPFGEPYFEKALLAVATQDRVHWLPWLRLMETWKLSAADHAPALRHMLETLNAAPQPGDAPLMSALLGTLAHVPAMAPEDRAAVMATVRRDLASTDLTRQADACRAFGHLASLEPGNGPDHAEALAELRRRLDGTPYVLRVGAMEGLIALLGAAAIPDIAKFGQDQSYTYVALGLCDRLGSPMALPFLDWAADNAISNPPRVEAKRVATKIRAAMRH